MEQGEILTRSLAGVAVGCYLLRVLVDAWDHFSQRTARRNRCIWTLGCLALWLHIAAAFHFIHDWSHADAVRQTARQTEELIGLAFGGGVYFNYAFAGVWLVDVAFWWREDREGGRISSLRFWTVHALFAFMMLNATVVFGPVYWRPIGLMFLALLALRWLMRRSTSFNKP